MLDVQTNEVKMRVAVIHDYVTQRGGAERVVLDLLSAFPGAVLHTAVYEPSTTFPEYADHDVRTSWLNRVRAVRRDHRMGLPLYAAAFSAMRVDADVVLCSSSGWAHGVRTAGRKIVYCHNPARWLYQREQYLRESPALARGAILALAPALRRWDLAAARSADRYLANSTVVAERVWATYGITAEVVPPPPAVIPGAEQEPVAGIEPGFVLCVARLQPYKNVDVVIRACERLPGERLVIVGKGPDRERLQALAGPATTFLEGVSDAQLRWLYAHARALAAASYEDYGLTPLEIAAFGHPAVVLRWGGYLDTVVDGTTGIFFDQPDADSVAEALRTALGRTWDPAVIKAHCDRFARAAFIQRMQRLVADVDSGEQSVTAS
jgi:glycosyltransferase involved in cell wall biosynthesis